MSGLDSLFVFTQNLFFSISAKVFMSIYDPSVFADEGFSAAKSVLLPPL